MTQVRQEFLDRRAINIIVNEIFPLYSDEQLSALLKRRPNKNSILHKAVLKEMGMRCAIEYKKENQYE